MITIVGGVYRERCMRPAWDDIYGSAGRAATAIARFGGKAELQAYVDSTSEVVLDARAAAEGFQFNAVALKEGVTFEYIHGLYSRYPARDSTQLDVADQCREGTSLWHD